MKPASLNTCLGLALATFALSAAAQTQSMNMVLRHQVRAAASPASPEAHIAPTTMPPGQTSIEIGSDRWTARGYNLKMLISQIYDIEAKRIDFADNFDENARYDVTLSLPHDVDETAVQQLLTEGLQKKFNVRITPETRSMEVYVMSAPRGPGSELHRHDNAAMDAGQITYSGRDCPGISSHGIEASATTISEFKRALEQDLDSVLVDETKLPGSYDFKLATYSNTDELLAKLHDQLGLVLRPLERKVTVLKVRPQGEFASL